MKRVISLGSFVLIAGCLAVSAWAQQVTAAFTGKVTDPSGAAVVGAKITATDVDRGTQWPTVTNGDGAFSAPGGEGFYPWVDASKAYYGLIARAETGPQKAGFQSVQCGRLLRAAWDTGVQQTGTIPKLAPARAETGTR